MPEATKVYDLGEVTCNFLGAPLDAMGGWGEGGAIKWEKESASFTYKKGADGSVARSKTYDRVTVLTLTLLQTASANAFLSGILSLDEAATNGAGVGPLLVRDRQGLTFLQGSEAWIEGHPKTVEFGPQAGNLEWRIVVADANIFVGGN